MNAKCRVEEIPSRAGGRTPYLSAKWNFLSFPYAAVFFFRALRYDNFAKNSVKEVFWENFLNHLFFFLFLDIQKMFAVFSSFELEFSKIRNERSIKTSSLHIKAGNLLKEITFFLFYLKYYLFSRLYTQTLNLKSKKHDLSRPITKKYCNSIANKIYTTKSYLFLILI